MKIIALQIGLPETRTSTLDDGQEAVWTSSIFKRPITGKIALSVTHLDGDGQADLKNHGGRDKAVCAYAREHYDDWQTRLGREMPWGAFGENATLDGLTEETACLGDVYQIGTATVQISQPRQPCWKLGRKWERADLPKWVMETGKTGWYFRVLQIGQVGAGDTLTLTERPLPDWPLSRLNEALYVHKADAALARRCAALTPLAEAWKRQFRRRAGLLDGRAS